MAKLPEIRWLDVLGGLLLPIGCLVFDPLVFRSFDPCALPLLRGPIRLLGYSAIGLGLLAFAVWLICGARFKRGSAFMAGILALGAGVAALLGLGLLPFSLLGIIAFGLGLIGLIPFLTAYVFWRNARAAWAQASSAGLHERRGGWALAGVVAVFCAVGLLYWPLSQVISSTPPIPEICASMD